jgi:hypothetical protein
LTAPSAVFAEDAYEPQMADETQTAAELQTDADLQTDSGSQPVDEVQEDAEPQTITEPQPLVAEVPAKNKPQVVIGALAAAGTEAALVQQISAASQDINNPTTITISNNIVLTNLISVPKGKYINFVGSSSSTTISAGSALSNTDNQQSSTAALLKISGNVSISNLTIDVKHYFRCVSVLQGGSLTVKSGANIKNGSLGKASNEGANIKIDKNGTLIINGGTISGARNQNVMPVKGLGVFVGVGGTFTMTGGVISDNSDVNVDNLRCLGGGVYLDNYGSAFTMSGGENKNNSAKGGGGGVYVYRGTFNLNGGTISGNTTETGGGGIYSLDTLNMNGGSITGNTASSGSETQNHGSGGGVYNMGIFTLSAGVISNNKAETTSAKNTQGFSVGQGGGIFAAGQVNMIGGSITGNKAQSTKTLQAPAACGGGIAIPGGSAPGSFSMSEGTISGNNATGLGGGIYLSTKEVIVAAAAGTATTSMPGNGVFIVNGAPKVKSNTGKQNAADNIFLTEDGYATIAGELAGGATLLLDSEIKKVNTVVAEAASGYSVLPGDARKFLGNDGVSKIYQLSGGYVIRTNAFVGDYVAIETANFSAIQDTPYSGKTICPKPTVKLGANTLIENEDYILSYKNNINTGVATVRAIGTGKYNGSASTNFNIVPKDIDTVSAGAITDRVLISADNPITPKPRLSNYGVALNENDYTLEYGNNQAVGTATITAAGIGNYTGEKVLNFTIISSAGAVIAADQINLQNQINSAVGTSESPTVIYITDNITLTNTIEIPAGRFVKIVGNDDDLEIGSSAKIINLVNVNGEFGAENITLNGHLQSRDVLVNSAGTLSLEQYSIITNGRAADGAGIKNEGRLILTGGTVSNNIFNGSDSSSGRGGGIYNTKTGTVIMEEGAVSGNANIRGGGIYNEGTAELNKGLIADNKAIGDDKYTFSGNGGGIYNVGSAIIKSVSIENNSSTFDGGGIYNTGVLTINDGTVSANTAEQNGGGVFTSNKFTLEKGIISNNIAKNAAMARASACGGGVFVASGTFEMLDGSIIDNSAISNYVDNNYYASLGNGGGVYVSNGGAKFNIAKGNITGNKATSYVKNKEMGHGGGIYIMGGASSGSVTIKNCSITNNTASNQGGGIFAGNHEDAYSAGSFNISLNVGSNGAAGLGLANSVNISGNGKGNLYLKEGTNAVVTAALTGSIGVTLEKGEDAIIAKSSGYIVTSSDASVFKNDADRRTVKNRTSDKTIILKAIELKENYNISIQSKPFTYDGSSHKAQFVVIPKSGSTSAKLTGGTDYVSSYVSNTTDAGTKKITVNGRGEFTGELQAEYQIVPKNISQVSASVADQIFTGKQIKPVSQLVVTDNGKALLRGAANHYTIKSYGTNTAAGLSNGSLVIAGVKNYTGEKTISFHIKKDLSASNKPFTLTISKVANKAYTGKAIIPAVTVKDGSKKMVPSADYDIAFSNNKNTGKATISIVGKGFYVGKASATFNIIPGKAKLKSLKSSKKKTLKVTVKKDSQATGYQILIAKDKKFKKGKKTITLKSAKVISKTVKKLKSKKVCYVKVRSYKTIDGKKYYGTYSKAKKVKIK